MQKCYPEIKEVEQLRKLVGRYGITGKLQVYNTRYMINTDTNYTYNTVV